MFVILLASRWVLFSAQLIIMFFVSGVEYSTWHEIALQMRQHSFISTSYMLIALRQSCNSVKYVIRLTGLFAVTLTSYNNKSLILWKWLERKKHRTPIISTMELFVLFAIWPRIRLISWCPSRHQFEVSFDFSDWFKNHWANLRVNGRIHALLECHGQRFVNCSYSYMRVRASRSNVLSSCWTNSHDCFIRRC